MIWNFYKLREDASIRPPAPAKEGDLGYDLFSCEGVLIRPHGNTIVKTGIGIEFPTGWGGIIHNRSSMSLKNNILVGGGVIDSGYRGEIQVILHNLSSMGYTVEVGDKIAQLIPHPVHYIEFNLTETPNLNTERGDTGFGSTGR